MSEFPQEVIDTLRNVIALQSDAIKQLTAVIEADKILISNLSVEIAAYRGKP